jgi:hypothetical protein
MKGLLEKLIHKAGLLGLPSADVNNAQEFLDHHEFGLCLDIIIDQIYEYEIEIDNEFYQQVLKAADRLNIPRNRVNFIEKLLLK